VTEKVTFAPMLTALDIGCVTIAGGPFCAQISIELRMWKAKMARTFPKCRTNAEWVFIFLVSGLTPIPVP
jgi:hypothetical protein